LQNKTKTMFSPTDDRMTAAERRAGISLAAVFALRMLGLFLILPVFAVEARSLVGGSDAALVGFAIGAYGLTQAFLQIPFGVASDRFGRKPVIVVGLLLFFVGSVMAALSTEIVWMIVARVVQGVGAISAAVTALAADLTREQHRTKVMAMIGSSIGLVFALSLIVAPIITGWVGLSGIFWLTAALSLGGIVLILTVTPAAPPVRRGGARVPLRQVVVEPQLARLNFGVFALHVMQTSMWVVVPLALISTGGLPTAEHWKVYLPAVLVSFVVMIPAIIQAERHGRMKPIFLAAVALLMLVQAGLYWHSDGPMWLALWLTLFFVAFNVLEATQPSLISRIAPGPAKGAALGVYNTAQSIGLFLGGALGGLIAKHAGADQVHLAAFALGGAWLLVSLSMKVPASKRAPAKHTNSEEGSAVHGISQ
jgi:MFS family permease